MDNIEKKSDKIIRKIIGIIVLVGIIVPIFVVFSRVFCVEDNSSKSDVDVAFCVQESVSNGLNKIAEFSTNFATSSDNRSHNISLACRSIDGTVIESGEQFSFNTTVGERTSSRGYKNSLIIYNGVYTRGVGGGVCQVSTTLYNAWLLAGLDVLTVRNHTIPTSYVDLSCDAMVSTYSDLVLLNNSAKAVRISAKVVDKNIVMSIYSTLDRGDYRLHSYVVKELPTYDAPIIYLDVESEDEVSDDYYIGKCGYCSRLIREKYENGRLVSSEQLREDYYPPVLGQRIIKRLKISQD